MRKRKKKSVSEKQMQFTDLAFSLISRCADLLHMSLTGILPRIA
jgi:hypothetical protein